MNVTPADSTPSPQNDHSPRLGITTVNTDRDQRLAPRFRQMSLPRMRAQLLERIQSPIQRPSPGPTSLAHGGAQVPYFAFQE